MSQKIILITGASSGCRLTAEKLRARREGLLVWVSSAAECVSSIGALRHSRP